MWEKKNNRKSKNGPQRPQNVAAEEKHNMDSEIKSLKSQYDQIDTSQIKTFSQFPLSKKTAEGLKKAKYTHPTDIQTQSIGLALQGHDVLGAAKTGSGKTLAFVVPILEHLYCQKWTPQDGVGALVITPTRELAYQIFEVLRKIGKFHDFSAGLVIGGKFVKEERERISKTNIVICTPGRLLQHMDEAEELSMDNLQILVLDEADRILEIGFRKSLKGIISYLPRKRQTLLFSATQTRSLKDLATVSLMDPVYVSVDEHSAYSTPKQLQQSYIVCELEDKLNIVWSFLRSHLKSKILIFMSSCKQVRYVYESFKRLRPGMTVLALHGAMPQLKRVDVYEQFSNKEHVALFATDIASRGLDFPAVNWVIQMDCPENATTYIHRVGRTARYQTNGEALMMLLPSEEEGMIKQLEARKIPISMIKVNPKKMTNIGAKLDAHCAADPQLKNFAQSAFLTYTKAVLMMKNKEVFDVKKLNLPAFSKSLGLAIQPRVRILTRQEKLKEQQMQEQKQIEQASRKHKSSAGESSDDDGEDDDSSDDDDSDDSSDDDDSDDSGDEQGTSDGLKPVEGFAVDDDDDDEDFLKVKKKHNVELSEADARKVDKLTEKFEKRRAERVLTKTSLAKKILKKKLVVNQKVKFDEEGEVIEDRLRPRLQDDSDDDETERGGINIEKAKKRMAEVDKTDKQIYREMIRTRKKEARLKERKKRQDAYKDKEGGSEDDEPVAVLGSPDSDSEASATGDDNDSYPSDSDSEDEPTHMEPRKKRRRTHHDSDDDNKSDEDGDEQIGTDSALVDDEALATMLLS